MSKNKHVLVLGSGESSRANVEALLDDYFFSEKDKSVIVLAFNRQASQGQIFAAQFAKDNEHELVIFANEGFISAGLPQATVTHSKNPVSDAIKEVADVEAVVFMLWSDEDMETANIIKAVADANVAAFDLTDGLTHIDVSKNIQKVEEPKMPESEATTANKEHPSFLEQDEGEEGELDEEELSDEVFAIAESLQLFAKVVAKEVVKELKKEKSDQ